MKKFLVKIRKFLNLENHHSIGAIQASISLEKWGSEGETISKDRDYDMVDLELVISDCNRSLNLSFDVGNPEEYANGIYKLETMIDTLVTFKKGYEEAYKIRKEIKERKKQEEKDNPTKSKEVIRVIED